MLNPSLQRRQRINVVVGWSAATMGHAGHHKQTSPAGLSGSVSLIGILQSLIIPMHLVGSGKHRIRESLENQQLASFGFKTVQVGRGGIIDGSGLCQQWNIPVKVELQHVKIRLRGRQVIRSQ